MKVMMKNMQKGGQLSYFCFCVVFECGETLFHITKIFLIFSEMRFKLVFRVLKGIKGLWYTYSKQ